jgi:hypothetical protein
MKQGRVIEEYESQYPDPIVFSTGEVLSLGRQDPEWPGWIWCTSAVGKKGWVPERMIERVGDAGVALLSYTARELSVQMGDLLDLMELESGWYWAANQAGETGWIPERNLLILQDGNI